MLTAPHKVCEDHGWRGWGHWLGTGNQHTKEFLPFDEALAVARILGLPGKKEWKGWPKKGMRPRNVPADPSQCPQDVRLVETGLTVPGAVGCHGRPKRTCAKGAGAVPKDALLSVAYEVAAPALNAPKLAS